MDADELYHQYEVFLALAKQTSSEEEKALRNKIASNYYNKWLDKLAKDAIERENKIKSKLEDHGIEYDEWIAWAESLYTIEKVDSKFLLRSNARDWVEERNWIFDFDIDAKEKRFQLVGYKIHDRKRGRGSMEKDLN